MKNYILKWKNRLSVSVIIFLILGGLFFLKGENLSTSINTDSLSSSIESSFSVTNLNESLTQEPVLESINTDEINLSAASAGVYDVNREEFVFEHNINAKRPVASITKLMTGLLIAKYGKYTDVYTVSQYAYQTASNRGYLNVNETLTIYNFLKTALVTSSNDASVVLAEYLGGKLLGIDTLSDNEEVSKSKESKFVELMNKEAKAMGLINTNYTNPHGLDAPNSYSTVEDVTILFKEAVKDYDLKKIMGLETINYDSIDGSIHHEEVNTNDLLKTNSDIIAGKTGSTDIAKENLVVLWESSRKSRYIIVVLGSDNRYEDTEKIINKLIEKIDEE